MYWLFSRIWFTDVLGTHLFNKYFLRVYYRMYIYTPYYCIMILYLLLCLHGRTRQNPANQGVLLCMDLKILSCRFCLGRIPEAIVGVWGYHTLSCMRSLSFCWLGSCHQIILVTLFSSALNTCFWVSLKFKSLSSWILPIVLCCVVLCDFSGMWVGHVLPVRWGWEGRGASGCLNCSRRRDWADTVSLWRTAPDSHLLRPMIRARPPIVTYLCRWLEQRHLNRGHVNK